MENIHISFREALVKWKEAMPESKVFYNNSPYPFWPTTVTVDNIEAEILHFEHFLMHTIIDNKINILDKISNGELTERDIFKRRAVGTELQGLVVKSIAEASNAGVIEEATKIANGNTD